jgi:hypothetical protein
MPVDREAGGSEVECVRVKRVVDRECLTDLNFVGALPPVGGAFRRRRLAVGYVVSQWRTCRV